MAWVFSCTVAAYFQNAFPKSTSGGLHLNEVYQSYVLLHYAVVNSPVNQGSERIFYWYFNHLENLLRKIWAWNCIYFQKMVEHPWSKFLKCNEEWDFNLICFDFDSQWFCIVIFNVIWLSLDFHMFAYVNMLNGVSYLIGFLRMFRFDPPVKISKPRFFYVFRRIKREHWKEMNQTISLVEIKFSQEYQKS